MKRKLLVLALGAAGMAMACSVQAKDLTGWFVNGGVGSAHYHATYDDYDLGSESDSSAQINFGWRSQFIGVEAGYIDLGSVDSGLTATDLIGTGYTGAKAELSGDGWTVGLNGHFNPTKMWYISARGGLFMWKLHYDETDTAIDGAVYKYSASRQSADWYAGVGTGVDFNRHMSLGINFDFYKIAKNDAEIDNKVYTVNFEYRF